MPTVSFSAGPACSWPAGLLLDRRGPRVPPVDQPEFAVEALLEWLDDRIAVSPDPGSRTVLLEIRRRLGVLSLRERQLEELIAAMRPNGDQEGDEPSDLWVVEGDVAARVVAEVEAEG